MTKGFKIVLVVLIVLIGLLATITGFLFAKTNSLQKKLNSSKPSETAKNTSATETAKTSTATTQSSTSATATTAAPLGNRPSSPSDTVSVGNGETLFTIGQKAGVSWTILAEANGIDADKIQAGQTIIVPKNGEVGYTVSQEKAQSLQKDVDSGKYAFRLSPVETAKSDAPTVYGLATTDTYTQTKIDESAGSAEVTVTKADKTYIINLVQPVTKGAKGIWAIESVKPQS